MTKASKPALRAVAPDEKVKKQSPKTIKAAVTMDERALLVALRERAASEIDAGVPPAYLAPLMRQLRDLDKEVRSLDVRNEQEAAYHEGEANDEVFDASAI